MMENRDIRFRAWNGKEMITDFIVGQRLVNALAILVNEKFAKGEYKVKMWKVMQFTGLKDKNKKDVFEGDILADEEAHYRVYWDGTTARWDCERLQDGELMQAHYGIEDVVGDSCIIGNVFENPELSSIEL